MWCYQIPGFKTLLLAELQRQQQCSQFCDTLLKAEGVSVPAHSCVLSAISPQVSSALLSSPAPPAGQNRMLEFQALGACNLLHMVRLLYSGEMAGEGEREKEEAISAAANLGIQGLVEVTKRDQSRRNEMGGGLYVEVGVQTELSTSQETRSKWNGATRDENAFLGKKSLLGGEKDMWTQTEEWQVSTVAPQAHSADSLEPNNMAAIQSGAQFNSQILCPQMSYIPISVLYTPENHINQLSIPTAVCIQDPAAGGGTQTSTQVPQCVQRCSLQGEEWQEEQIEEFQDNIPGFINYFLNPEKEEGNRGRRGGQRRRRRRAGVRRARAGERQVKTPQTPRSRGRGGTMQTVDVQNVGVSRLQKQFLHRWSTRAPRTGQGGGAAGRKLYLKTREVLKKDGSSQKRKRSNKYGFEESEETTPCRRPRGKWRGNQDIGLPNKDHQRAVVLSSPPPFMPPASSLLHTTCLPPLTPLPVEDHPERIDRLLEEVMMGLDIIPNEGDCRSIATQCCPITRRSNSCTYGSFNSELSQKTQPEPDSVVQRAGAGSDGSHVAAVAKPGGSNSTQSEEPLLQQPVEGELTMMLDRFLQSFEQQIDKTRAGLEGEGSKTQTVTTDSDLLNSHTPSLDTHTVATLSLPSIGAEKPQEQLETQQVSTQSPLSRKKDVEFNKKRKRKRRNWAAGSKTRARVGPKVHQYTEKILLPQVPVVRLTKRSLSLRVTLQEEKRQSLEVKCPTKPNCTSTKSRPNNDFSEKNGLWSPMIYPLRSRLRKSETTNLQVTSSEDHMSKKEGQPQGPTDAERSSPTSHSQPDKTWRTDDQSEKHKKQSDLKRTQGQRGRKRSAGSQGKRYDGATKAKRICLEEAAELLSNTFADSDEAAGGLSKGLAVEAEVGADVTSISLVREEGTRQEEETRCEEAEPNKLPVSTDKAVAPHNSSHLVLLKKEDPTTGWEDEDIDVIGWPSPLPHAEPETIIWTVSSEAEDEEEDVEVV